MSYRARARTNSIGHRPIGPLSEQTVLYIPCGSGRKKDPWARYGDVVLRTTTLGSLLSDRYHAYDLLVNYLLDLPGALASHQCRAGKFGTFRLVEYKNKKYGSNGYKILGRYKRDQDLGDD